jgi:ParB family transcriptional regulator, chromosome partitioning protein
MEGLMARKNPFANLMGNEVADGNRATLDYTVKGASKSILSSIDEIAAQADKLLEGHTVVDLDPNIIDSSFVKDRLDDDPSEFQDLLIAIKERGQDSPILVRPHPKSMGRYMVVFGHRRVQVAKALGRQVRAVIREMDDQAHVIAQGQENSARSNLSFIERAIFAQRLSRLHYDNENSTVLAALSVDKSTLSKMLSVVSIPEYVLEKIGAAKSIGRDRWYELKMLLDKPANLERANILISAQDFLSHSSDDRFSALLDHLKNRKKVRKGIAHQNVRKWVSTDKGVSVDLKTDGKTFTVALKAKDAVGFGEFLSENLPDLYTAYKQGTAVN